MEASLSEISTKVYYGIKRSRNNCFDSDGIRRNGVDGIIEGGDTASYDLSLFIVTYLASIEKRANRLMNQ